jgi:Protein kinase domain
MSPAVRRGLAIALALLSLGGAAVIDRSLSASEGTAQSDKVLDAARERARSLQGTLKSETERLVRTAASASGIAQFRALVVSNDEQTIAEALANEAWWKEYRTSPLQSAVYLGEKQFARSSREGPTEGQLLDLVKKADSAGRSELVWAAEGVWATAAVRLPAVVAGDTPLDAVVLLSRPIELGNLPGTWVLSDGRTVLGKHGPDAELMPLMASVGHEKQGTHLVANGAAAAVDLMPGVWLWALEASPPAAGNTGRTAMLFGLGGLLAVVALIFGFKAPSAAAAQTQGFDVAGSGTLDRTAMSLTAVTGTKRYGEAADDAQPSRYEVIAPLGEGGMARVFLARTRGAEGFTRTFVLKRLRPELLGVPESVTQFIDEARLGSKLVHSNIVPVFDFGRDAEGYYLAQEYILGRDLDHLRKASLDHRRMPLEARVVLYVAREALRALSYVHTRAEDNGQPMQLVHRDVSPNNLMISARGEVKLLDLGIAKSESNLTKTQAGMVKGNVFFMAPEQARGEPVDARADLFSLGLVIFAAATGDTLYTGASNYELLHKAANGLSPQDWARVRALPPAISVVLEKALQANPAERFASADAFAAAIPASVVGTAQEVEQLMQAFFADEFRREQQTLQVGAQGA